MRTERSIGSALPKRSCAVCTPRTTTFSLIASADCDQRSPFVIFQFLISKYERRVPMMLGLAFWPSKITCPVARMNGAASLMLVDSRTSASASSSDRREPPAADFAPDGRAERMKTMSEFEPRFAICSLTAERAPWPRPVTVTTAATPIVMPRTVSAARSVLRRTARSAMTIADRMRANEALIRASAPRSGRAARRGGRGRSRRRRRSCRSCRTRRRWPARAAPSTTRARG